MSFKKSERSIGHYVACQYPKRFDGAPDGKAAQFDGRSH
jgi:hypothetical protein